MNNIIAMYIYIYIYVEHMCACRHYICKKNLPGMVTSGSLVTLPRLGLGAVASLQDAERYASCPCSNPYPSPLTEGPLYSS